MYYQYMHTEKYDILIIYIEYTSILVNKIITILYIVNIYSKYMST